jgi:hypothetical protein
MGGLRFGMTDVGGYRVTSFGSGLDTASLNLGSGNSNWTPIRGLIVNGANAGTVQLQFKANTGGESNVVGRDSWFQGTSVS